MQQAKRKTRGRKKPPEAVGSGRRRRRSASEGGEDLLHAAAADAEAGANQTAVLRPLSFMQVDSNSSEHHPVSLSELKKDGLGPNSAWNFAGPVMAGHASGGHALAALLGSPTAEATAPVDVASLLFGLATVFGIVAFVAVGCAIVVRLSLLFRSGSRADLRQATNVRAKTELMVASRGAELRSMFGVAGENESDDAKAKAATDVQPMRPGMLMRVQGRVVAKPGTSLMAPFSSRHCVLYSASASHQRHDSVHQPPLAFFSSHSDFEIEALDEPGLTLAVHGQDVSLFDMGAGLHCCEHAFSSAPVSLRGFVIAHPAIAAAPACGQTGQALGSDGLLIDFRECALVVGSVVTCVGEVARDRCGRLGLVPWQPAPQALGYATHHDPLVGRVMISDDPSLIGATAAWRARADNLLGASKWFGC